MSVDASSGYEEGVRMSMSRVLQNSTMTMEERSCITVAYEQTLYALGVQERDDALTEMIAEKVIKIAQTGIRNPAQISARAIKGLGVH